MLYLSPDNSKHIEMIIMSRAEFTVTSMTYVLH